MPKPESLLTRDGRAPEGLRAAIAWLTILVGLVLFLLSPWWARPVAEAIESLPAGKWLTVPVPFVPLLLVLLGAALWRRDGRGNAPQPGERVQSGAARNSASCREVH